MNYKGAWGNFCGHWICLMSCLWWWFHGYKHSKLIKCHFKYVQFVTCQLDLERAVQYKKERIQLKSITSRGEERAWTWSYHQIPKYLNQNDPWKLEWRNLGQTKWELNLYNSKKFIEEPQFSAPLSTGKGTWGCLAPPQVLPSETPSEMNSGFFPSHQAPKIQHSPK